MSTSKTVLITGATSGIGGTTAKQLIAQGHRVAVTGRNKEKLDKFVASIDAEDRILGIQADAADWEMTQDVVKRTVDRFGGLDAAIANAGFVSNDYYNTKTTVFDDGAPTLWPPMVLTNVLGPALLAKATFPHLQKNQRKICDHRQRCRDQERAGQPIFRHQMGRYRAFRKPAYVRHHDRHWGHARIARFYDHRFL